MGARFILNVASRFSLVYKVEGADAQSYCFATPNQLTLWRAKTFFEKEPETLEWIDGFLPDSVFYDIGANVGLYTVYAAKGGKVKSVISFEPESGNYALLNRNIALNSLQDSVSALNVALSDKVSLDTLYLYDASPGAALHSFGEAGVYIQDVRRTPHKQGAISFSLDRFVAEFSPPFPNYIKIDVDGLEAKIIAGAGTLLADRRLKGMLIEIDETHVGDVSLVEALKKHGFMPEKKKHSAMVAAGDCTGSSNYIFTRNQAG